MPFHNPIPERKSKSNASSGIGGLVEAEKLMQIAFVLPSAALLGLGAGWWADKTFHTKWMEIAGVIFGSVVGLFYVIRLAIVAERSTRMDASAEEDGKGKPQD